jgi:uncharacterized protein YjbI with pentapeptide repeats
MIELRRKNGELIAASNSHSILELLLANKADLRDAALQRCELSSEDECLDFARADMRGADLSGANLSSASLRGVNLVGANLSKTVLEGTDLAGADLSKCDARGAYLYNARLYGADLSYADLTRARMGKAKLQGASLRHADLTVCDLHRASLDDADFYAATLDGTALTHVDLRNARITYVQLVLAKVVSTYLPVDWSDAAILASGRRLDGEAAVRNNANLDAAFATYEAEMRQWRIDKAAADAATGSGHRSPGRSRN